MLLVTRVAGSTENFSFGGAGQKARSQQVVRWQRKGQSIKLRHVSFSSVANEEDPIYESVINNNFEPVVYSFDIKADTTDSTGLLIDATKLYTSDVPLLSGMSSNQRQNFQVRRLDGSRSFIEKIASYPENIEVRHVLTYDAKNQGDRSNLHMAANILLGLFGSITKSAIPDRLLLYKILIETSNFIPKT